MDLVERRLLLHFEPGLSLSTLQELGQLMADEGAIPPHQLDEEVQASRDRLAAYYGRTLR